MRFYYFIHEKYHRVFRLYGQGQSWYTSSSLPWFKEQRGIATEKYVRASANWCPVTCLYATLVAGPVEVE